MRHSEIMIPTRWLLSESIKARIDHPEDLVFDEAGGGARKALNGLLHAAAEPRTVTIKWDGSPALIFGRDDKGFSLTDKSGFGSKQELPRSPSELANGLFMRRPGDEGRQDYANSIARLWPILERVVPESFRGFVIGDLLWNGRPTLSNGTYTFRPNKISYSVPAEGPLGQLIGRSKMGMAVHGLYTDRSQSEPNAVDGADSLGLQDNPDAVIMGASIDDLQGVGLPVKLESLMKSTIERLSPSIDRFLDRSQLAARQITDLGSLMKRYVNSRAYSGQHGFDDAASGFAQWIDSGGAGLTDRKRQNVMKYLQDRDKEHKATWSAVDALTSLKDRIKDEIDRQVSSRVSTELRGKPGHEGYVADTPYGRIKMVNRPHFMRKD